MVQTKFTKTAGELEARSLEDSSMRFIGIPNTVTLPQDLGGCVEKVIRHWRGSCACRQFRGLKCYDNTALWLELETVQVAECPIRGFLWVSRPGEVRGHV